MPSGNETGRDLERPPRSRPWRPTPLVTLSLGFHAAALAAAMARPRLRRPAALLLFANHVALVAAGLSPRSRLLGPNVTQLSAEATTRGEVALTFDDGPDPQVTPRILEALEERGARASFFVVGRKADRHRELVAEVARRGHRVESHTYSHPWWFSMMGPRRMAREIDRAQEAVLQATGRAPRLLRAPAGFRNALLEPLLARRGLWLASWTRRAFDTVRSDAGSVVERLTAGLASGEVLLLHDGGWRLERGGRPVVLEVLPRLLDELERRGLRAVPFEVSDGAPTGG